MKHRGEFMMKKKIEKIIKIILITIILLMIIGIIFFIIDRKINLRENVFNKIQLKNLKYDIVLEEDHDRNVYIDKTTGLLEMRSVGGYANNYSYILINSKTNEKIEINFQDVYSMHEEKDNVNVVIKSISNQDVEEYAKKYGKSEKLLSVKAIIDKHHKEYEVNSIENNK